ncbi:MAG: DUF3108 domain-containing protein [Candidatus Omnitrophota bacterium]
MQKIQFFIILLIIFSIAGCATTGTVKSIRQAEGISEEGIAASMSVKPGFHVRKRLTYLMAWNSIPIGSIVAEIGDIREYQGRDVYVVTLVTRSNKFLSKIYNVEDTYITYIDTGTMTSRRYEADRKEGNYRKHVIVEYDFDKSEAIYTNLTDGSVKRCPIEKNVQDPLSVVCYFMTLPVKLGDKIGMTVNLNEKNYKLYGQIESVDIVKLPRLTSYPAFKIRPYAVLGNKRVKKGSGWMYFMAGKNRYPLYGVVWIPFGRVTSTLSKIEDF